MDEIEDDYDNDNDVEDEDRSEQDFQARSGFNKKRVDIMGPISLYADRLGLSMRQRCTVAASVVGCPEIFFKCKAGGTVDGHNKP